MTPQCVHGTPSDSNIKHTLHSVFVLCHVRVARGQHEVIPLSLYSSPLTEFTMNMCGASSLGVTEAPIRGRDPRGFWLFPCSLTKQCSCPSSGSNTKYLHGRKQRQREGSQESNGPEKKKGENEIEKAQLMLSSFLFYALIITACLPVKLFLSSCCTNCSGCGRA